MTTIERVKKITTESVKARDGDVILVCKIVKTLSDKNACKLTYRDKARLQQYVGAMRMLKLPVNKLSVPQRRRIIIQQGSGFLSVLLPIAIGTLWSILSRK